MSDFKNPENLDLSGYEKRPFKVVKKSRFGNAYAGAHRQQEESDTCSEASFNS